eukprot:GHVU01152102.1.p2 GENE.GHVU01152102.1~~GHVU01152102.1.p2  ORF type:complete len:255 (+),score=35.28 GHVU01152102.1:2205-2969(+)
MGQGVSTQDFFERTKEFVVPVSINKELFDTTVKPPSTQIGGDSQKIPVPPLPLEEIEHSRQAGLPTKGSKMSIQEFFKHNSSKHKEQHDRMLDAQAKSSACRYLQLAVDNIVLRVMRYDGRCEDINAGGLIYRSPTRIPPKMVKETFREWLKNPQDLADTAITNAEDPVLKRPNVASEINTLDYEFYLLGAQCKCVRKELVIVIREQRVPQSYELLFLDKPTSRGKKISPVVLPRAQVQRCCEKIEKVTPKDRV